MSKKPLKIALLLAVAVIVIAGISVGVTMKLKAGADSDYRERIAANKDVEINGEKLYYIDSDAPEYQEETYYRKAVYKDNNGICYTFDADTQELRWIENTDLPEKDYTGIMAEDLKPYFDTNALIADAEKLINKWCDKDTKAELEFECTHEQWNTSIDIYQVINDEIRFGIGSVTYNEDGEFLYAVIKFDSMLDSRDIANMLSEEEAIKTVKAYLEETYGESGWEEIKTSVGDCGKFGSGWIVTCIRYERIGESRIVIGYLVVIDVLTGEIKFVDQMK